ncbi:MAG: Spy/CpxP family protein refolding chaperone [Acidobacteriota bacterium]
MKRAVVVAIALAFAIPIWAQQPPDHPVAKNAVIQFLGLSPDQTTQWDGLFATFRETAEPLWEQLQAVEDQLRALLQQSNPDPAQIGALVLQGKGLRDQIGAAHQTYLTAFEALLSTDQQAKLWFMRRAARAEPLIPAFRLFRLVPLEPDRDGPPPNL